MENGVCGRQSCLHTPLLHTENRPHLFRCCSGRSGLGGIRCREQTGYGGELVSHARESEADRIADTRDRYHIDELASDIVGVMQQLEIERAHVVGSSMGAEVGLSLAARGTCRRPD